MARKNVAETEVDDFETPDSADAEADAAEDSDDSKTPEEKFVAAANRRYKAAVARIRSLAKLHSTNYGYTPEQGEQLITAVQHEVDNMATLLRTRPQREQSITPDLFS